MKRFTSVILVLAMVLSMVITCASAEATVEYDTEASSATVKVTTWDEMKAALTSSDYSDYSTLTVQLQNDIQIPSSSDVVTSVTHKKIVIDGQSLYTLSAPSVETSGSVYMFTIPTTSGYDLTFRNITIDANNQGFINFQSYTGSLTLNQVTLKNGYSAKNADAVITCQARNVTSYYINPVTINGLTTENCSGTLLYAAYVSNVTISDSTLTTSANDGASTYVVYVPQSTNSNANSVITIEKSEISWTGDTWKYGLYVGRYNSATIEGSTISGPSSTTAAISVSGETSLTLNSSTVESTDEGTAVINYENASSNLTTDGNIQGNPQIILPSKYVIQLTGVLQNTLYYSFSSISGDPTVVVGTTGDDGYTLTDSDLEKLVYSDTDSIRTLKMDTTTKTDEDGNTTTVSANSASLYRMDLADCGAELLDSAVDDSGDAVTATLYAYTAEDGSTVYAADTASVTTSADEDGNTVYTLGETTLAGNTYDTVAVPVYYAAYHDGAVEPDVQVSTSDGTVVGSGNYTVTYSGDTTVEGDTAAETVQAAVATVAPANDLTGDAAVLPYAVVVASYTDLGAEGAPVTVSISYDSSTGDQYTITVKYNDETLVEGTDYQVASYEIDTVNWVANITIEGLGDYGGTYTLSVSILGKDTMVQTVYDEDTLNAALAAGAATIYLSDSFTVTDSVVIDYNVTIDGQGEYAIYVADADADLIVTSSSEEGVAILSVQGGSVTLTGLTVDGGDQARCLYVADGASVELTGGSVLTGGGISGTTGGQYGLAIYIAEGGAVTLDDCQVRDSYNSTGTVTSTDEDTGETTVTTYYYGTTDPIYNLGTLTVQDGAYLTNLPSLRSAIYNAGTLNWTGGTFDVDLQGYYSNTGNGTSAGAVINNQGTFNLSGGTINGFLDEDETEYTTAYYGAVYNGEGAELTLSDGTITGFNATGSGNNYRSGGGGVHNEGTFTMTGGAITKNTSVYTDSTGMDAEGSGSYGGGVYNAGVFYFTGGEISYNSAALGGGVYNEGAYCPEGNGNNDATTFVGEFYMSDDAALVGNTLTGDTFSTSSSGGMMNNGGVGAKLGGSALCVAGGSTAVISGGTITGDESVTVDLGSDENGNAVTETVSAGIAVIPSQATNYSGHDGAGVTVADDSQLTITGSPDIQVGVLLLNIGSSTETATLLNYGLDGFDASDTSTYQYIITSTEATEVSLSSWLALDGDLETALNVSTVTSLTATIQLSNVSATGTNISTTLSDTVYKVNTDGDLVAVYTNDRIVVSEDDADLFTLADGIGLYLTTADITEDDVTTTYNAWAICAHSSLTYVESADATCTEAGHSDYYQCDTCGAMFDAEGNELTEDDVTTDEATGHSLTRVAAKDATCTEVGYSVTHYKCSVCGALFDTLTEDNELTEADVTIAATGHTWTVVEGVEATCDATGLTAGVQCSVCGEWLVEQEEISVDEDAHNNLVIVDAVAPTCTETGLTTGVYCNDCGTWLVEQEIVAATGHTYGEGTVTVASTRYTTGVMSYTCTTCGETFTTKIAKTNASFLFDDVTNSGSYYYKAVYWAYDLGITAGTSANLFSPSASCTRGQFVTFLYRLAQATGADTSVTITGCDFTDVSSSASYYQAMLWAVQNEITNGTTSTTFSPSKTITRAQAVTMLYRYEKNIVNGGVAPTVSTTSTNFTDVVAGSSYEDAVLWAVENGITSGTSDTTFSPSTPCTRAMMVTFLYNYAAIQD